MQIEVKKRVLVVTHEMLPYVEGTDISKVTTGWPERLHEDDLDLRILMPRFGTINERRHRLHEVVRLSGINVVINDEDFPLVIKVASLPGSRLQCYFLDNDEFFYRKSEFKDGDGNWFDDNFERMLFFCLGAFETVKKFGWAPDVIHAHGWMTALMPLLLKTTYKDEPIFQNTRIVYTAYKDELLDGALADDFTAKVASNTGAATDDIAAYGDGSEEELNLGAMQFADAVTVGSEDLPAGMTKAFKDLDVPKLDYTDYDTLHEDMADFFHSMLEEEEA